MKIIKYMAVTVVSLLALLVMAAMLSYRPLPQNDARTPSMTLPMDESSLLVHHIMQETSQHPDKTGVYPFANGLDSFVARLSLVETAKHSLDIRYYIWKNDISGALLTQRIFAAADRGVRVRILLDDNSMAGMDGVIKALDDHPNIEVRLFNPFMHRRFRWIGFLNDFDRLNQRMHNKSFTADSAISIVGGRNVGDEYFGAGDGMMFADMDVAVVGKVMPALNEDFDRYWASERAYPANAIIPDNTKPAAISAKPINAQATKQYIDELSQSDYASKLIHHTVEFYWADARLISDNPMRVDEEWEDTVTSQIVSYFQKADSTLTIVSPYFVPTDGGVVLFNNIARDTDVKVLTNSLAANDVAAVHSGYAKYRKPLLNGNVGLYELKTEAAPLIQKKNQGLGGSYRGGSGSSLHAKIFIVDERYLFVGSYNLDPRSAIHNTEMGIIFDAPEMAAIAERQIRARLPDMAYQLKLEQDKLAWHSHDRDGTHTVHYQDPDTKWHKRFAVWLMSWLPIESLL